MTILVSGGAGYIGSHTCVELLRAGYEVVVADDLVNASAEAVRRVERIAGRAVPFHEVDLCVPEAAEQVFAAHPDIGAVIHFAALKAVGESVARPLAYYANNLRCTLSLLEAMQRHGVRQLVFSSSATVYGDPSSVPIREDAPLHATNPYGQTKLAIEQMLTDCCRADPGLRVALLRYFNPIGAHPSGLIGEDPNGIPNNLVPYIAKVAAGQLDRLHVFGDDWPTPDGTGVRDYIHVVDLARGHVAALRWLAAHEGGPLVCNLGTGRGHSVLDVLHAYERACGRTLPYVVDPRRPGDVAALWADTTRAQEVLGWRAELGIDEMCADSWRWQSRNPEGYQR